MRAIRIQKRQTSDLQLKKSLRRLVVPWLLSGTWWIQTTDKHAHLHWDSSNKLLGSVAWENDQSTNMTWGRKHRPFAAAVFVDVQRTRQSDFSGSIRLSDRISQWLSLQKTTKKGWSKGPECPKAAFFCHLVKSVCQKCHRCIHQTLFTLPVDDCGISDGLRSCAPCFEALLSLATEFRGVKKSKIWDGTMAGYK